MFERFLYKSKSPEIAKAQKDFERYRKWLHFDENQLQGKTILDIGSADSRFGEYVEQQYPDTKVLRFDVRQEPDNRVDFIARADQIPLKAETIDLALAHASIAQNSGEYVIMALEEIFSVIKKGGEIRVAPIFDAPFPYSQNRLRLAREYVNDLEKQGRATGEWIDDGTKERILKNGQKIQETRYCLVIKKIG